jgi:hypothetical protein
MSNCEIPGELPIWKSAAAKVLDSDSLDPIVSIKESKGIALSMF